MQSYQHFIHRSLHLSHHLKTLAAKEMRNGLPMTSEPGLMPFFYLTEGKANKQSESCSARWTLMKHPRTCSINARLLRCSGSSFNACAHDAIHQPCTHLRARICEKDAKALIVVRTGLASAVFADAFLFFRVLCRGGLPFKMVGDNFFSKIGRKSTFARRFQSLHTLAPQPMRGKSKAPVRYPPLVKAEDS